MFGGFLCDGAWTGAKEGMLGAGRIKEIKINFQRKKILDFDF